MTRSPDALREGDYVYVADGPCCGYVGCVDFVDPPRKRSLIQSGEARSGLRWELFVWLRRSNVAFIPGCMKPRSEKRSGA